MSNEMNKNLTENVEETSEQTTAVTPKKAAKAAPKKDNFFNRFGKKIVKLCKDTAGEMKKVVWTPKTELKKNTKLVIFTVIAVGIVIVVIDTACSYLINTIAGLIG